MPGLETHRRTSRLPLRIPVVITGKNFENENFSERAETLNVGKFGVKVLIAQRLRLGALVLLRPANSEKTETFRVVYLGEPDPQTRKYPTGLEMSSIEDFWGQSFPPDNWQ